MLSDDEAWEKYRKAVDSLPMGSEEWANAVTAGPWAFKYDLPLDYWKTMPLELHETLWRSYWGIPKESETNAEH